jgi:hypothetical protein
MVMENTGGGTVIKGTWISGLQREQINFKITDS